ncbi:MAG: GNAT family N-acetyltransferase [Desulfuromonadaceae bacterium]|nr:GNAT family N-acetyltransferase [Desulfuromonadaceae bacterium]MDD5104803.1 GNAT family N-acetyltransferase [Desulfuromonadaceae bacterium]
MIDTATIDDIPRLSELLTILFTQEAEFTPDPARQAAGLRCIIENPSVGHILVLREESVIIGMVNLLYTVSTALGEQVAILEDMIVDPTNRGGGSGAYLLNGAIEFAKKQKCRRITLLTDKTNNGAIKFYERHGFEMSEMVPLRLFL